MRARHDVHLDILSPDLNGPSRPALLRRSDQNAFSADLARQCRDELWADIGLSPSKPEGWTRPVIRVSSKSSPAFIQAANTPPLHKAFDQLVGVERWIAPRGLGTFPIRFPSAQAPGDDGWHVDVSFGLDNPDFMEWRANVRSSG